MKRTLPLLLLPAALFGQNPNAPVFPGSVATDSNLYVATNNASSVVVAAMGQSDTSFTVASTSSFTVPAILTINYEKIAVCSKTQTVFTVCSSGRGYDGTTAQPHAYGSYVAVDNSVAWYHNQLASEIKAIESRSLLVGISVTDKGADPNGVNDSTTAFNSAITSAVPGDTVRVPAGTYKTSGTVIGGSNVLIFCDHGATISYTGSGDAVSWTDKTNFSMWGCQINAPSGNGLHVIANATNPLYPDFENVQVNSICSSCTGIYFEVQTGVNIFFPMLRNVVVNGGSASPNVGTRTGLNFINSIGASITVAPQIIGGRFTNLQTGIGTGDGSRETVESINAFGTAFDGITTNSGGTGTGVAIKLAYTGYARMQNLRFEINPDIDTYFTFDSNTADSFINGIIPAPSGTQIVDNGTRNGWSGTDGSGGIFNKMPYFYQWTNAPRYPSLKSNSGTRYICIDTNGTLVSQTTACSGT